MEPAWVRNAIWWHVYPLGFTGAFPGDAPGEHRLGRVTAWLEHAVRLGASGLALGPIFASATHGYDTIDHYTIDPRLGDDADFDELVERAHANGLRVQLDGVFNHVAHDFRPLASGDRGEWLRVDERTGREAVFEGHEQLLELEHRSARVRDYVVDVMTHWLARGVDAWRLDAAYRVDPAFWAHVLPRVAERFPDAYVVGEVIHGDYARIVADTRMSSVTQYELWKAIWSSLHDRNPHELAHALARHDTLLDTFVPATFVGNHDVTRIATQVGDHRLLPHAIVALFTLAGTPSVYAGDEFGLEAVKEDRAGGDDAVRPEFPPSPEPGVPDADLDILRLHQELIGLRRRLPWLHAARSRVVGLDHRHLRYESAGDGRRVWVALNVSDEPIPDAVHGPVLAAAPGQGEGELRPFGWAVTEA